MNRAFIYGFLFLIMTACATAPKEAPQALPDVSAPSDSMKQDHVRPEEEIKSFEIFKEIFSITRSARDRQSILPEIEALYKQIIRKYPETPLAQESHWRLINIYVNDYSPPDYEKAEKVYHDFLKNNNDSPLKGVVADTLGKSYVKHAEWERLLAISTPSYRDYIEKKMKPDAALMFMYAESNYKLGNMKQAKVAYAIVSDLFPGLRVGKKSKSMIDVLGNNEK